MTTASNNSFKGLSNNNTNINHISNDRESDSTKYLHENENNRKLYPQRNNRSKLNYRDLERGMYEEIRQSMWTLGGPTLINKSGNNNTEYRDDDEEEEVIDLSIDEDEKSKDDVDQMHCRLQCICKKPWDQSRLMLRCNSCANWYHGDCIEITKEQARALEINGDQFICPSCRGISHSIIKPARSFDESILIKRKRTNDISPTNDHKVKENEILSKRPKTDNFFQRDLLTESQIHCIVQGCNNLVKFDWIYCSSACIRRHINDTLQAIQRSKGTDNEDIPTSEDILLYESKSKKILEKNLVPKIEDLCTWINQHPSYEIVKSPLRQSILSITNQSTDLTRSLSSIVNTKKSKLPLTSVASNQRTNTKSISNKKNSIQLKKQTSNKTSNINNTADIRSKVPTALYDKIIMRLEKNGEKHLINENIRIIVNKIEEEMYRVYGKVDNSYKNKFRSLIANISNMNNNFFYKQILSKELTAKQIVAMKAEDMLPPEEKEKRKDQFEKEVQMIINAEQQTAEEMARRARIKDTRQSFSDNDAISSMFKLKEQSLLNKIKDNQSMDTSKKNIEIKSITSKSIDKISKSIIPAIDEKSIIEIRLDNQTSSSILSESLSPTSLTKKIESNEPLKLPPQLPIPERSNPIFPTADLDNDYIEPESPTGIDALIYDDDDDDDDDDSNNIHTSSHSSTIDSSIGNTEYILPYQQIIRDDYNPSKIKNETTPIYQPTSISRLLNHWRGVIHSSDIQIPCQSVHIYGESDYLIGNIPEQLIILGRLRLRDLWDYIRDSLSIRDVLILTLISSSINTNDNEIFLQYIDTMHISGRAAVISKCTHSSLIRDMYILPADTKDCPSNVLSSLFLPITFESKQLFLIVVGSGKRTIKSINGFNENQSLNNLIYKPVALHDSTAIRDPRLLRNKDPRLSGCNQGSTSISIPTMTVGDNLTEENMDVDDDQDDKHKKQIITSSTSNLTSEFNDVDYRFLHQDMDHHITTKIQDSDCRKQRRKSRFSDRLPTDNDQVIKPKSNISIDKIFSKEEEADFRTNNIKIASLKSTDKHINSSLNSKFRPIINSTESFISSINTKDKLTSKPIRFSFSKDPLRRHKSNILSTTTTTNNNDIYENSPKLIEDLIKQVQSYGYQGLTFSNDNWIKQTLPITPIRSTAMLNLIIQQQKTKNRFSLSTNEWKSSSNDNYMTHYHDLDQPQE